jgi:hypothetical protein
MPNLGNFLWFSIPAFGRCQTLVRCRNSDGWLDAAHLRLRLWLPGKCRSRSGLLVPASHWSTLWWQTLNERIQRASAVIVPI